MFRFVFFGFAFAAAAAAVYFYWFRRSETEEFISNSFDRAYEMKDNAVSKANEQFDRARDAVHV